MASPARDAAKTPFLPQGIGAWMLRKLVQLGGLALASAGVVLALALLSFDSTDPSFNRTGTGTIHNLFGRPGSHTADLLLQSIGAAAAVIVLALVSWGWRLMADRPLGPIWLRLTLTPVALLLAALALAGVGVPAEWPLEAGLGGHVGTLAQAQVVDLGALLGTVVPQPFVTIGAALLAVALLPPTLAITWRGAGGAAGRTGRRVASLGRSAVGGLFRRRQRLQIEQPVAKAKPPTRRGRAEPSFEPPEPPVVDEAPRRVAPGRRAEAERQGKLKLAADGAYELPSLDLLHQSAPRSREPALDESALAQNAQLLESVLDDFSIRGEVIKVRPGPVVTLYELEPAPGTKSSRVINLSDDIARSMSAVSTRVAVIPGRNALGIELPNARRETVYLRELLASQAFERSGGKLVLMLGKEIDGNPVMVDLARMPHLLIAGTTGSGKSVALHAMILSLLYRLKPDECKLILIDPKMLELSVYDGIPQLMAPVVTDPRKAVVALKWAVREMENRYQAMSKLGVRNIEGFNGRINEARAKGEVLTREMQTGYDPETGQPVYEEQEMPLEPLPYIVVVVDEMADLMLVAGKDIDAAIQRLAQMARAAGIHLIMATQRPSVDVITGTIKANFPTRVSFQVTSKIDSRTILGEQGAEQLLGQGDMLYMAGGGRITRVHGPFVTDDEVEDVARYLRTQGTPVYVDQVTRDEESDLLDGLPGAGETDELYDQAVALVLRERKASTSFVQRHLQIGYNRAARIVERMEAEGLISPANRVGKREILVGDGDV